MAFTLRMVVVDGCGRTVAIVETRRLRATALSDARTEADRHSRRAREPVQPNAFEIVDPDGTVVARRRYRGRRVSDAWS